MYVWEEGLGGGLKGALCMGAEDHRHTSCDFNLDSLSPYAILLRFSPPPPH